MDETVRTELTTVLELVSHETRARTLVELAVRQRESPHDEWLSFSELRRRVGHDDPGNFNYHLGRLRGSLVERADAGYRLSDVGHEFVAVLLSSRFDPDDDVAVPDETVSCLLCSAPARPAVMDGRLFVECEAGHTFAATVGPDVLTDQSVHDALDVALFHALSDLRLALSGVCASCDGPVEQCETAAGGRVAVESGVSTPAYSFLFVCRRCGGLVRTPAVFCVADHPRVTELLFDHGIDVRASLWSAVADHLGPTRRVGENPSRVAVPVTAGDDETTLTLDETATVTHVE